MLFYNASTNKMFIILVITYVKNIVDHNFALKQQLTIHQKYLNLATFLIYYSNYNFLYSRLLSLFT